MEQKRHYNARPQGKIEERLSSPIYRLRLFNNWVKAVLIQRALASLSKRFSPPFKVLDMACGKGGDLTKYKRSGAKLISQYVGVDIADVSVDHALARFQQGRYPFRAGFYAGDAFGEPIRSVLKAADLGFAVVSCQFALHYAFKTEETARQAVENVSEALMPGGIFICTLPNAEVVEDRIAAHAASNPHYRITLTSEAGHGPGEPFGREYTFWLSDAIDSCPEYMVPSAVLVELCRQQGLVLSESLPFSECYLKWGPDGMDLLRYMGVVDARDRLQMSRHEMCIAELYNAYTFIKEEK